jgi:hypothetical protein
VRELKPKEDRTEREWVLYYGAEAERKGRPIYLGTFRRPEHLGPLRHYLLWCEDCGRFQVTHPHGYGRRIECARCRRQFGHLLPVRRTLLNPFSNAWFVCFLALLAFLVAIWSSRR